MVDCMASSVRQMGVSNTGRAVKLILIVAFIVICLLVTFRFSGPSSINLSAGDGERHPAADDKSWPSYFYDSLPHAHLLNSSFAPNVVYYVWCGQQRWFEFQHYLSVMSVVRLLRPDNIVFCYDVEPVVDELTYNTWYSEIADSYPFFRRRQLPAACVGQSTPNMTFVRTYLLTGSGGMYMNEHTILSRYPLGLRLKDLVVGLDPTSSDDNKTPALLATKPRLPGKYHAIIYEIFL